MNSNPAYSRLLAVLALLMVAVGCTTIAPVPTSEAPDPATAINAYARVLQRFVNDNGEVDFSALRDDRIDLDRYVAFVAKTPAASFTNADDRLAQKARRDNSRPLDARWQKGAHVFPRSERQSF